MRRLLIVEDERLLARLMQVILEEEGYEIVANVTTAKAALGVLGRQQVDAAVLDINIEDGEVYPVARQLSLRRIPFGFCTSMTHREIREEFKQVPLARKPVDADELIDFVRSVCQ